MFDTPLPEIVEPPAMPPAPMHTAELQDRAEIKDGQALVQYSATEAGLATLKANLAGKTYDLKTTKGDQAARADRLLCVNLRAALEKKRKAFKAPALEFGKKIDAEAARITAEIEALEKPIDEQIKADEKRRADEKAERERLEAEAAAKHTARISTINAYAEHCRRPDMTAARIQAGMAKLTDTDVSDPDTARAVELADAKCRTLEAMRVLHARALELEAQAAENERLRKLAEEQAAELARMRAAEAERQAREEAEQAAADAAAEAAKQAAIEAEVQAMLAEMPQPPAAQDSQRQESAGTLPLADQTPVVPAGAAQAEGEGASALSPGTVEIVAQPHYGPAPEPKPIGVHIGPAPVAVPCAAPEPATIKLGDICAEMGTGFSMTSAFASMLGVQGTIGGHRNNSILFTASQRRELLLALADRAAELAEGGSL